MRDPFDLVFLETNNNLNDLIKLNQSSNNHHFNNTWLVDQIIKGKPHIQNSINKLSNSNHTALIDPSTFELSNNILMERQRNVFKLQEKLDTILVSSKKIVEVNPQKSITQKINNNNNQQIQLFPDEIIKTRQ
jgi:hypothetical protein